MTERPKAPPNVLYCSSCGLEGTSLNPPRCRCQLLSKIVSMAFFVLMVTAVCALVLMAVRIGR